MADWLGGKTILVVDDEADLRAILCEDLETAGAAVAQATNGRKAYELFLEHGYDAIVSDVRMPDGDGIELMHKLRADPRKMPCLIFITGFADITADEAGELGVHGMLYKPFSLKELRLILLEKLKPQARS